MKNPGLFKANPAQRPVSPGSHRVAVRRRRETSVDCRAYFHDAGGQGVELAARELPMTPKSRLDFVRHARYIDGSDRTRAAFQGMGGIDAAWKLAVAGNHRDELLTLSAEKRENIPFEIEIAESLPRKMLRIEHCSA